MAERQGSKASLIARVWPDVVVSDVSLSVLGIELRKVLGDDPKSPMFIETSPPPPDSPRIAVVPFTRIRQVSAVSDKVVM